mgnify:FL=1
MGTLLAGGLILLLSAGCVATTTQVTGVPFLGEVPDARVALDRMATRILAEAPRIGDVERLLQEASGLAAVPWERWWGDYRPAGQTETYTWRFAHVQADRLQLGIRNSGGSAADGYALTVTLASGRVIAATAESTRLTKEEVEWLSHNLVSVGAAAAGTAFMLLVR